MPCLLFSIQHEMYDISSTAIQDAPLLLIVLTVNRCLTVVWHAFSVQDDFPFLDVASRSAQRQRRNLPPRLQITT